MEAAITLLKIYHEIMVKNEPINRAEGNIKQANLEKRNAEEIKQALATLQQASKKN